MQKKQRKAIRNFIYRIGMQCEHIARTAILSNPKQQVSEKKPADLSLFSSLQINRQNRIEWPYLT